MKSEINRDDIQIISRHSDWSKKDIAIFLKENIYSNKNSWQNFLQLFFLSVGISFIVAGILFFFAYNWNDLHKFAKIGLIESLIITLTLIAVYAKIKPKFKNIILAGNTMLVGVLFAVFGQIYQTGANAYDFFLGWTMAVALWVMVSNFTPLWLIFIVLINVTFGLYIEQVAPDWSILLVFSIYIVVNSLFLIGALFLKNNQFKISNWFTNLLALGVICFITIAMINGIFDKNKYFGVVLLLTITLFTLGILYGLKQKKSFYLATIPFSVIIISTALLLELIKFKEFEMLFFISLFVVVSVTFVIKIVMNFQKKWYDEK